MSAKEERMQRGGEKRRFTIFSTTTIRAGQSALEKRHETGIESRKTAGIGHSPANWAPFSFANAFRQYAVATVEPATQATPAGANCGVQSTCAKGANNDDTPLKTSAQSSPRAPSTAPLAAAKTTGTARGYGVLTESRGATTISGGAVWAKSADRRRFSPATL
jgi:hypothetical protein